MNLFLIDLLAYTNRQTNIRVKFVDTKSFNMITLYEGPKGGLDISKYDKLVVVHFEFYDGCMVILVNQY